MREIEFRAKRIDNGKWLISNGLKQIYDRVFLWNEEDFAFKEVQNDTLGQYTGLRDKNGKKIFEGDIISHKYFGGGLGYDDVSYMDKVGYWYPFGNSDDGLYSPDVKVVGNIHDNPELMNK